MSLSGWGNHAKMDSEVHFPGLDDHHEIQSEVLPAIPRGNGRSYGDSGLYRTVLSSGHLTKMLHFDYETGLLTCQAGVLLDDILNTFVPRGWFLPVTPGTRFVSVGGAIAADVHGKNHHRSGCFSEFVESFDLLIEPGRVVTCSRNLYPDLFHATCGGMGLTGFLLRATFRLVQIPSASIQQTQFRTRNLIETLSAFEQSASSEFSVAWIDTSAGGASSGRGLFTFGDFSPSGEPHPRSNFSISIPKGWPGFFLSPFTIRLFNRGYYACSPKLPRSTTTDINTFFYPLDAIRNWNRLYGNHGFMQYQCIIPKEIGHNGLSEILSEVHRSGLVSPVSVLKLHGPANKNLLSFPLEGYSLAMDFKMSRNLREVFSKLDRLVLDFGGRLNLCKDSVMSREVFDAGYPNADQFRKIRAKYGFQNRFRSLQSERLQL